jgi:TRAP-type C4-dicarboxylate transport system substrate-binding protein
MQITKVKWLIHHEPVELFLRTAESFSDEIKRLTGNRIQIDIITETKFINDNGGMYYNPVSLLQDGVMDMCQFYSGQLGQRQATDFYSLDLPFLFSDHEHAARVFDGDVGKHLLETHLPEKTKVRGLAFAYSGGYRVFASSKKINCPDDMKDTTMAFHRNPIFKDVAKAFGGHAKLKLGTTHTKLENDHIEDCEIIHTTLPRYQHDAVRGLHKYVSCANHSMFLTALVVSEKFWSTLTIEDQMHMRSAALHAARLERSWTIADSEKVYGSKNEQEKLGIEDLSVMDEENITALKESSVKIYSKYEKYFTPNLIQRIKDA